MDEQHKINREFDIEVMKDRVRWGIIAVLFLAVVMAFCGTVSHAATAVQESTVTVQLKRGTSLVTLLPAPTTLAECEQRRDGLIALDAQTKFSGTSTYSCIETRRMVIAFSANPPPPPVDCVVSDWSAWVLGTPTACVNGQQTRTDSRSRTIVTQPANGGASCPSLSETTVVMLACQLPPPPVITAPTNLTGTVTANATNPANSNIKLTWDPVTGAGSYEVYRSTGATCSASSTFGWLADTTTASYANNNLPPGLTYCFRVRTWTPAPSPYTEVVKLTTLSGSPPPPPPPPAGTGSATVDWVHDGNNLAGFRVLYGLAPDASTNSVQVPSEARSIVINGLAVGTWYFAPRAYNGFGESANGLTADGKVASKVIAP